MRTQAYYIIILLLIVVLYPHQALAQSGGDQKIFGVAIEVGEEIFDSTLPLLRGMAVLGTLGVAALASFGKMPWAWAFAIITGLVLVSIASLLRSWVTELAQDSEANSYEDLVGTLAETTTDVYLDGSHLVYIFAGIAIISLGVVGMFSGKFNFKWFIAIISGLVILAASDDIISFIGIEDQQTLSGSTSFN